MSPFPARRTGPPNPKDKLKKVTVELIRPNTLAGGPIYARMDALMHLHHEHLLRSEARIALMWNTSWEPDDDGRCTVGTCERVNDKHRELLGASGASFDFIITLRKKTWEDIRTSEKVKDAILDHELTHAEIKTQEGEPVEDERGRKVYRIRKHDIEEFSSIARRYGCYRVDLEEFAAALEASSVQSQDFIGPTALQRTLAEAGADLTLATIAAWSGDEKRSAYEWALLARALGKRQTQLPKDVTTTIIAPEHVSRALRAADEPSLPLEGKDAAAGR